MINNHQRFFHRDADYFVLINLISLGHNSLRRKINNHNRVPCHEHAQLPRRLNGRCLKTEVRGRILFTYTGNDAYIYYTSKSVNVYVCVCVNMFSTFFSLSIYPSYLTHIVVGTCLRDRCCRASIRTRFFGFSRNV